MYFQQDCPFEYVVTLPCTYPGVYPGMYEVSNDGRIFDVVKGFEAKPYLGNNGYFTINLKTTECNRKPFTIHRLVAWEFCPKRDLSLTVNHIDCNKLNNMYWNLEWVTQSENSKHAFENGLIHNKGENNGSSRLTERDICEICQMLKDPGIKASDIAKIYNVSSYHIREIANGVAWTHITSQFPPIPKRLHYGEYSGNHKLTEELVHQVLQLKQTHPNLSYQEIADQFGVSATCIRYVLIGRTWKQIPPSSQSAESGDQS